MAKKPKIEDNKETLINVGDENEEAVEIELDTNDNPNIKDQLEATPDDDSELETEEDDRSPEKKLHDFLELNPDVSEYRNTDIKGRINKLTYESKEAERQKNAAIEFAQGMQTENAELKSKQQHQDGVFINEHKSRLESQMTTAKKQYQEAHELGDSELIADAQERISKTAAELSQVEQTESSFQRFVKNNPNPTETVVPYQPPAADPSATSATEDTREIDPKASAWAAKNEWFGDDQEMTQGALTIHNQLVTNEGYLPTGDGYYAELDQRLRKNFPDKFNGGAPGTTNTTMQGTTTVTPATRSTSSRAARGSRNVHLTPSEVAIAKKLGVPLEEYAKYKNV